jgi:pimeloyl-ACP methyl ester carboxylesterase
MTGHALALVLASALAAGCGGHDQRAARASPTPAAPALVGPPGRLVDIGGGRSLFAHCTGHGEPTILLDAGFGATTFSWRAVQPRLARTARTCSYDRAGFGSSVGTPGIRDARDELADLEALLPALHARPPYVLVGHSYGGLLGRLYAAAHPGDVAGMVQVDAKPRDVIRRQLAIWPRSQMPRLRRDVAAQKTDGVDLWVGERLGRRVTSLGDMPLVVVTAGRNKVFLRMRQPLGHTIARQWMRLQDELARLSSDSIHVVALRSDHPVANPGQQPAVVALAVETVEEAVRSGRLLPPCARVFHGPGVRCR